MSTAMPEWRVKALRTAAEGVGLPPEAIAPAMAAFAPAERADLAAANGGAQRSTETIRWSGGELRRDAAHALVLLLSEGILAYDSTFRGKRCFGWWEVTVEESPFYGELLAISRAQHFGPDILRGGCGLLGVEFVAGWDETTLQAFVAANGLNCVNLSAAERFTSLQLAATSACTYEDAQASTPGYVKLAVGKARMSRPTAVDFPPEVFMPAAGEGLADRSQLPRAAVAANLEVQRWQWTTDIDFALVRKVRAAAVLGRMRHGGIIQSWERMRCVLRVAHFEWEQARREKLGGAWARIASLPPLEREAASEDLSVSHRDVISQLERDHHERIRALVDREFGPTGSQAFDRAREEASRPGAGW